MFETTEEGPWPAFLATRDVQLRNELVQAYLPLVEVVLRGFKNVRADDREDLRSAGSFGLVLALDLWRPGGMRWLDFARIKIRYAMVDQIREMTWVPKGIRNRAKKVEVAEGVLLQRLGREPTRFELAQELGVTEEAAERMISSCRATDWNVISFEGRADTEGNWYDSLHDPDAPDPQRSALWGEEMDALELVLQRLNGQDRQLIEWKFFATPPMPQKAMAARLGVHESRVSQLIDAALDRARHLVHHPMVLFPEVFQESPRLTRRES